jgi:CHAT domain-containing protein/tetratricopeptide (TPR) repeat protein
VQLGGVLRSQRPAGWGCVFLSILAVTTPILSATNQDALLGQAAQLIDRVRLLYIQGQYQDALPIAKQAFEVREEILGPLSPDSIDALYEMAQLTYALGDYVQAEQLYLRTLEARDRVLGRYHPDVAAVLTRLGNLYAFTGSYEKSEELHKRALNICEKMLGPGHPETARVLNNLGSFYSRTGSYAKAEAFIRRSLAIREKALGPDHIDTTDSLYNLAVLRSDVADYDQAEVLFSRTLAIRERLLGLEHAKTGLVLRNLGQLYRTIGNYEQAEWALKRGLTIAEKSDGIEHQNTAAALDKLAVIYMETGAYKEAEPLFERALTIFEKNMGPQHIRTAGVLINAAVLYHLMGEFTRAELLYQRVIAIYEKAPRVNQALHALTLTNLAELYVDMGAYAKAEPLYLKGLSIREKLFGADNLSTSASLYFLANLYAITGSYEKAEKLHRRALAIRKQAQLESPSVIESTNALASLRWRRGDTVGAARLFAQARENQAKHSARVLSYGPESRRRSYLQTRNKDIFKHISFSLAAPSRDSIALGLVDVLQYKGRVLDVSSDNIARLRRSVHAKDRAVFQRLSDIATQFSNLTYQESYESNLAYKRRLDELSQQKEILESTLARHSSEFRRQVAPVTIQSVQRNIPTDAALVEWFRYTPFDPHVVGSQWGQPRYVAFLLKSSGDSEVVDIGDAQTIDGLVGEFLATVSDANRADIKIPATALSAKIIWPVLARLKEARHLLVSPDGALNRLPMAALLGNTGEYLAKDIEISYLTSGRDLMRVASAEAGRGGRIVVADPDYGKYPRSFTQTESATWAQRSVDLDRGGLVFRPLNGTALEAQALKTLMNLPDSNILMRQDATEARLKSLHGPNVLHVASHGFFLSDQDLASQRAGNRFKPGAAPDRENPLLRSGIALTGANLRQSPPNDDGILTALEVAQLDLHGTELVVLSACETGLGEVQNGEGVYGLRRALVLAGAQTQITSLWKVSDESTRRLIVDYYDRLSKGEGRSAALQSAQKTMLATADYSHPYYWASFIAIGNWKPLTKPQ